MSYYIIFNDTYQYLFTADEFESKLSDIDLEDFMIIEILPEIIIEGDVDLDILTEIEEIYLR